MTITLIGINGDFTSFYRETIKLPNGEIVTFYKSWSPNNNIGTYNYSMENLKDIDDERLHKRIDGRFKKQLSTSYVGSNENDTIDYHREDMELRNGNIETIYRSQQVKPYIPNWSYTYDNPMENNGQ